MTDLIASLWGDDVVLTRRGAQLVDAALELVTRHAAARNGGIRSSAEFDRLRTVVRLAAEGRTRPTSSQPFTAVLPSSEARVTVAEAAAIHGVTSETIRKAIVAGRLAAERHGQSWSIRETDARQFRIRRRKRDGQADAAEHDHRGGESREDHPAAGGDLGEVGP